jgi:hypothetical protein
MRRESEDYGDRWLNWRGVVLGRRFIEWQGHTVAALRWKVGGGDAAGSVPSLVGSDLCVSFFFIWESVLFTVIQRDEG